MPLTEYDIDCSAKGGALRVRFRTERGRVVDLVVQYEATIAEQVYPVVRFDGSHGRDHRDTLDARGDTLRKVWLSEDVTSDHAIRDARAKLDDIN